MNNTMKKLILVIAFLLFSSTAWAVPILNMNNGHYYEKITRSELTWLEAKNAAESLTYLGAQGHLATLTDQAENDWVWSNVGENLYFLGGTDSSSEGSWEWVTGEVWSFTNWGVGEPNNAPEPVPADPNNVDDEDYLHFWNNNGEWNDIFTTFLAQGYIVEFEPVEASEPIPEPATIALLGIGLVGLAGAEVRRRRKKKAVN